MKKRLQTRFPAKRIKKIIQSDEDIGKIANAVPVLVSKALELFLQDLCTHTYDLTVSRDAKTLNPFDLKQCVHTYSNFDFLKGTVSKVPDLGGSEAEGRSATKRRKIADKRNCNDADMMETTQMVTSQTYPANETVVFGSMPHNVKQPGSGRERRGRGRGRGRGGARTGSRPSPKFEDDVEDVSPRSSMSLSHDEKPEECVQEHNNHNNSEFKVRNFDLNVSLDENGDSASSLERRPEGNQPLFGINDMKIDTYQQDSTNEEDYDEE